MNINERIKEIRRIIFNNSTKDFAIALNVSSQAVSNYIRNGYNVGREVIENILKICPSVNSNWLLTGEGLMLKSDNQGLIVNDPITISTDEGQPILDIRICAGQGIGLFGDENKVLSRVNIPDFKGCIGVIVYGESMYDKYAPGDAVFVREISDCNYIENGQPYIVITKEDRLLKLVYQENDKLSLVSYNTVLNPDGRRTFPDMVVEADDILFLYKVVGRLARNQV